MSDTCPTVRIADPKAPGGFVEVNEDDFDEKRHKLYDESSPVPIPELRGKLPDDFPAKSALEAAGVHTYGQARKVSEWTAISGVGVATAAKIQAALAAKPESEDEE